MLKIGIVTAALLLGAAAPAAAPGKNIPAAAGAKGKGKDKSASEEPASGKAAAAKSEAGSEAKAEDEMAETGEALDAKAAEEAAKAASKPEKPARRAPRAVAARGHKMEKVESDVAPAASASAHADPGSLPPSVSAPALHKELGAGTKATGHEPASSEREKLESLSADLARARAALQAETARLEAMMKKGLPAGAPPAGGAARPLAAEGRPEGTATMPIGDPMAPPARSPYLLPAPAAGQVDVVSKAIKGMKPEQAAALIAHLDRTLAADVLQRMKPADAGAVLGFLRPEMGAALATEIANRPANPAGKTKSGDKEKL